MAAFGVSCSLAAPLRRIGTRLQIPVEIEILEAFEVIIGSLTLPTVLIKS